MRRAALWAPRLPDQRPAALPHHPGPDGRPGPACRPRAPARKRRDPVAGVKADVAEAALSTRDRPFTPSDTGACARRSCASRPGGPRASPEAGICGAWFRLLLLIGRFGFAALDAVILNTAMSLVVVARAPPFRAQTIPPGDRRRPLARRRQPAGRQPRRRMVRRGLGHQAALFRILAGFPGRIGLVLRLAADIKLAGGSSCP